MRDSWWHGRRVLVTGHTGFKGAWLTLWLRRLGAHVSGVGLAPTDVLGVFEAAGVVDAVDDLRIDITDRHALVTAVASLEPEVVFHLAAQAVVAVGYTHPLTTYDVNVGGTLNLLEAVWRSGGVRSMVVVTTDKVYANDESGRPFTEQDPLGGRDPYSSSKACADIAARSWAASYGDGPALATARAGNVIGGGDRAIGRLVPDIVRAVESGTRPLLRRPNAIRPWQHVLEPLRGYLVLAKALHEGSAPSAVNFGPDPAIRSTVADLADAVLAEFALPGWDTDTGGSGMHEASALALDASLAASALGVTPVLDVERTVRWTARWYHDQAQGRDLRQTCLDQIAEYEELLS